MNQHISIPGKTERVLIETDEFIFPIRIEQVLYAEIDRKKTIRFYEPESHYELTDKKNSIISLLIQAGFIRIQNGLYINPKQVSEFKIKDQLVELSSGQSIPIQSRFRKTLITYFIQHNLFSD